MLQEGEDVHGSFAPDASDKSKDPKNEVVVSSDASDESEDPKNEVVVSSDASDKPKGPIYENLVSPSKSKPEEKTPASPTTATLPGPPYIRDLIPPVTFEEGRQALVQISFSGSLNEMEAGFRASRALGPSSLGVIARPSRKALMTVSIKHYEDAGLLENMRCIRKLNLDHHGDDNTNETKNSAEYARELKECVKRARMAPGSEAEPNFESDSLVFKYNLFQGVNSSEYVQIVPKYLARTKVGEWLNDEIITECATYMAIAYKNFSVLDTLASKETFDVKQMIPGTKSLKTRKGIVHANPNRNPFIEGRRFFFVPQNPGRKHWKVAVADLEAKVFESHGSLSRDRTLSPDVELPAFCFHIFMQFQYALFYFSKNGKETEKEALQKRLSEWSPQEWSGRKFDAFRTSEWEKSADIETEMIRVSKIEGSAYYFVGWVKNALGLEYRKEDSRVIVPPGSCAQQFNGCDCGVFTLLYMDYIARGDAVFMKDEVGQEKDDSNAEFIRDWVGLLYYSKGAILM